MEKLNDAHWISTWPSGPAGKGIWYLPYLQSLTPIEKAKMPARWKADFQGGSVDIDLRRAETIVVYGAAGEMPILFLHAAAQHRASVSFQRAHGTPLYSLFPADRPDRNDLLSAQIRARDDARRRLYVARTVVAARVQSQSWITGSGYRTGLAEIRKARTLAALRIAEAAQARRYFDSYFASFGVDSPIARRDEGPVATALDATLMLMRGQITRWIQAHHLSPYHGFAHEPSSYAALVFDLIEPYRVFAERAVQMAHHETTLTQATAVEALKRLLNQPVYCAVTAQWVRRKTMLHGAVLALRAYLSGEMLRLTLPFEGRPKPGRPYQVTYRLPGELAPPTLIQTKELWHEPGSAVPVSAIEA
jgi:CRISPR-associated endonuclease Cas1